MDSRPPMSHLTQVNSLLAYPVFLRQKKNSQPDASPVPLQYSDGKTGCDAVNWINKAIAIVTPQ